MKKENIAPVVKKKMKKRTKFTIFAVINLFWYTIAVLILSFFDKMVPAELTAGWFAAWTVELALLFGIKVKSKDAPEIDYSEIIANHNASMNMNNFEDDASDDPMYNTPDIVKATDCFVEDQIEIQDEDDVSNYDSSLAQ